ncbi:cation diffusion facilitator family transporter, partial [Bradyrhizobium guangdongense]|uniref:cation diffusion facilitator family transporter n=1 Tax=Bradyrhizobium guangdongense TaxID=1325090 RepID=UPI0018F7E2E3
MGNRNHHGHHHHDHDGHSHDHSHGHAHDHAHVHAPANFGKAFAIGITLNTALVVAEAIYGYIGNSTALLADAGHNLSDVLGLVIAWGASIAAKRAPSGRFTYGLRASTILAALANAVFLLVATGAIGWEAILRLQQPEPVAGITVMVVAGIGILINGFTALLFASGRKDDINIEGAYLHMAADAAVSLGVVVSAALIIWTGWLWLDPVTSLVICATILWSTT